MKRFLTLLIIIVLVVSTIGISSALAGASISGNSEVLAGKTYTYTGKASYSGASLLGTLEGLGQASYLGVDASSMENRSISDSTTIKVTIPSSAKPGDKYTIKLSGEYSYYDDEGGIHGKSFSASKTITVVQKAPAATKNPNATPRPPEGWEIIENTVADAQKGAVVEEKMEDNDYKIPESLLEDIIENQNILKVDFGTYTCTIDPAELTDIDGIKSLDLKLDFEKVEGLSEIAGGKDVYQLHFGHTGELPGKLSFTFKAEENQPGDTVYLYYYYGEANITEGKMQAVVDENGMVTFDIYHCSSYFVTSEVLEGAQSNFDTESATTIEELTLSLEEKQTELDDANAQIETLSTDKIALEADLEQAQQEAADLEDEIEEANAEPIEQEGEYPLVVLLAAVAAAVLLSILLTMLFTKAGLFRRSPEEAEAKKQRKAQMKRAKMEADQAKEQEKQEAFEAKQQAKRDAVEAKQQAKEAKKAEKLVDRQDEGISEVTDEILKAADTLDDDKKEL